MIIETLLAHLPELGAILFFLLCSAFFSGSETALFSLSQEDIRHLGQSSATSSRRIWQMLQDPQGLLSSILFGNMLVNISMFTLSVFISLDLARNVSQGAAVGASMISLLLVILFGEVSPKGIAVGRPAAVAHLVASPLYGFYRMTWPVRVLLRRLAAGCTSYLSQHFAPAPFVTREELKMLVGMAEQQGALGAHARGMIEQVVELAELRAKDVMTPRVDTVMFNILDGRDKLCAIAREKHQERVVAYHGDQDNVVGVIFTRDVFVYPLADLRDLLTPVRFVPETQPLDTLLQQLGRERDSVAIVVDEYGGMVGFVTMEHILEEIVGRMRDEHTPTETPVQVLDDDTYLLAGDLNAREWPELLGTVFEHPGVDTLGGFIMSLTGHVPHEGEAVEWRGLRFVVDKVTGRRIVRVRVQRARQEEKVL